MNLLDKYILEVGKKLPHRNRVDLQTEIRSTIEDMLEDRSKAAKRPIDDGMVEEVLKEYGSPSKVAAAYHPDRYLIGPQLFPFFMMVVKIVLGVLLAVTLGAFLMKYYTNLSGPGFLEALGGFALQFFQVAITAFGNIALVFAILERVVPVREFDDTKEQWKPSDLNAAPDPDQVSRGEMTFEIILTLFGLAFLNLYPYTIKIALQSDSSWIYVPALSDIFLSYLPWINLLGILSIVLAVYLLRQGFWQKITRVVGLVIEISGIILSGIMLTGPSLIKYSVTDLATTPVAGSAETLVHLVHLTPQIILLILIIVQAIEATQTIVKMIHQRSTSRQLIKSR